MDFIYLDNSIMTRVFNKEYPNFYTHLYYQIINERAFALTISSLMEFYGITNKSIYKKFNISSEKIANKINSSTNCIDKGLNLYNKVSEIYSSYLNKINKEQFHSYLLKKIKEKETRVEKMTREGDLPSVNLKLCEFLGEEYKKLISDDTLEVWKSNNIICYNFISNRNFTILNDYERERLSFKMEVDLYKIITNRFVPPYYQVFSNIWRIRKSIKRNNKLKVISDIFEDKSLKMKLKADRMDSELLFLSIFGHALKGGKPVQGYTMDNYEVTETRLRISLFIWKNLIESIKNNVNNNNGILPVDMNFLLEFNLGMIECVSYNGDKLETKKIDLNSLNYL